MKRSIHAFLFAIVLGIAGPGVQAKDSAAGADDGVKVDKMSSVRKLVSEEQVEAAALQQYLGIKRDAGQQKALAPEGHPQLQRLRAIANKIIPHALRWNERAAQWQWEVNLIGSKEINAFCMPGGKIAFYTGILDSLKLTDDEVAIVMGHEIAHALREHGRERLAKSTLTNAGAKLAGIGASLLFGVDPHLTDGVAGFGAKLMVLKFSRGDETEADLVGLDIAARAGYDPRAGIALWQKMGMVSKNTSLQWLSTHPAGDARIAEMQKHMPSVMPLFVKARGTQTPPPPYMSNVKGIAPIP
ncbi:M48 family metallopeptidase [Noviherbaspirillum denitrificans]|uniref:Peptidase M48 n=1 Tax=Noviherbaspirillum denitrificans TaxID=1968433 RepID=A0A254TGD9_9BURK|nr:M48 family metallopeptidase [Noviherbaspirillum denitrificans]OWW20362.1 peptidase M48 [Noviherbaspirillum denitrificans]